MATIHRQARRLWTHRHTGDAVRSVDLLIAEGLKTGKVPVADAVGLLGTAAPVRSSLDVAKRRPALLYVLTP